MTELNRTSYERGTKLDLILKTLYEVRNEEVQYALSDFLEDRGFKLSTKELERLSSELLKLGYIEVIDDDFGISAIITSQGVQYCEKDSFSQKGIAIPQVYINIQNNFYNVLNQSGLSESQVEKLLEVMKEKSSTETKKSKLGEILKSVESDVLQKMATDLLTKPEIFSTLFG